MGEMAKVERIAGDGILSKVRKSLRRRFFGDDTGIEVVTISGLRRKGEIGERG